MANRATILLVFLGLAAVCSAARTGPIDTAIAALKEKAFTFSQTFSWPWAQQDETSDEFDAWKKQHGVEYDNADEHTSRFQIYKENKKMIEEHNAGDHSFKLSLNQFADKTNDEFRETLLPKKMNHKSSESNGLFRYEEVETKDSVDWRTLGAVTPVKNQGQCGSCWSFSTTGSIEGINAIKTGKLVALSEQELVDCDTSMDHGCGGGLMDYAFEFVIKNGGLDTELDYPYFARQSTCKVRKEKIDAASISSFEDVPMNNEKALMKAATMQPVSVAIQANTFPFQFYHDGVLDSPFCGTQLDHAVLVVGYGTDEETGKDFWIVKNSWGADWGEEGYLRIARNVDEEGPGICGIAKAPSIPIIE